MPRTRHPTVKIDIPHFELQQDKIELFNKINEEAECFPLHCEKNEADEDHDDFAKEFFIRKANETRKKSMIHMEIPKLPKNMTYDFDGNLIK